MFERWHFGGSSNEGLLADSRLYTLNGMPKARKLSSSVLRRAENTELSLGSLEAIAMIRARLDELEPAAMLSARDKGATLEDIADALGLTPQAIYYRFRNRWDADQADTLAATEPSER
jgi:Bacterial regulatory proteins, tetR family